MQRGVSEGAALLMLSQDALQLDSKAGEGDSGELGSDMDDLDDYLTQLDAGGTVHTAHLSCVNTKHSCVVSMHSTPVFCQHTANSVAAGHPAQHLV